MGLYWMVSHQLSKKSRITETSQPILFNSRIQPRRLSLIRMWVSARTHLPLTFTLWVTNTSTIHQPSRTRSITVMHHSHSHTVGLRLRRPLTIQKPCFTLHGTGRVVNP